MSAAGDEHNYCPGCQSLKSNCRCRKLANRRALVEEILTGLLDEPVELKHIGNNYYNLKVRID